MVLTRMRKYLRQYQRVALDTSIFIYQLEANPRYAPLTDPVFVWLEESGHSAVTSTITMTELLVQPYLKSDQRRVDEFYGLLVTYPNLDWVAPDLQIADLAAQFRARHRLPTPDSLQVATAVRSRADCLITNDAAFKRVGAIDVLLLDEFL